MNDTRIAQFYYNTLRFYLLELKRIPNTKLYCDLSTKVNEYSIDEIEGCIISINVLLYEIKDKKNFKTSLIKLYANKFIENAEMVKYLLKNCKWQDSLCYKLEEVVIQ